MSLFELTLYIPVNNFSIIPGHLPGWNPYLSCEIKRLARSASEGSLDLIIKVEHSTTEPVFPIGG